MLKHTSIKSIADKVGAKNKFDQNHDLFNIYGPGFQIVNIQMFELF